MMQAGTGRVNIAPTAGTSIVSNPELLLKNLRLLDLDEEFNWPSIDSKTFSSSDSVKNLHKRLYCAAWILYKLFELYDPERTKRELAHLFPPLEPKQSSLLRSAVFKRLLAIKTAGRFGKDVVVRKTMFEDCKGSKFEELMAVFSSMVLLTVIQRDKTDASIVKRTIGRTVLNLDTASLSLALRVSLSSHVQMRETLQRRWSKFAKTLDTQGVALEQSIREHKSGRGIASKKKIPLRTINKLSKCILDNWTGDSEWANILLHGEHRKSTGELLNTPYITVWKHVCKDTLYELRPQRNHNPLHILEERLRKQRARLDRWKAVQSTILLSTEINTTKDETSPVLEKPVQQSKYSLRSNAVKQSSNPFKPDEQLIDDMAISKRNEQRGAKHRRSQSATTESSRADVAAPVLESRSRLRKPIANTGVRITASQVRASVVHDPDGHPWNDRNKENHQDRLVNTTRLPGRQIGSDEDSQDEISETFSNEDASAADIVSSVLKSELSPYRPTLTLAERTKISMSTMGAKYDTQKTGETVEKKLYTPAETIPNTPTKILSDLAERTRKSMSSRNIDSGLSKVRPTARSRPSAVYPINQFETPRKVMSLEEESIFDETTINLDETDIFKSRPKVAVSPTMSPLIGDDRESLVGLLIKDEEHDNDGNDHYEDDFS